MFRFVWWAVAESSGFISSAGFPAFGVLSTYVGTSSIPEVPAVRLAQLPTYTGSPTGAGAQKLPTYSWVGGRGVNPATAAAACPPRADPPRQALTSCPARCSVFFFSLTLEQQVWISESAADSEIQTCCRQLTL